MRTAIAAGGLVLAGLVWTATSAQVHREPSPGSGVVPIAGVVHVGNTPTVNAGQLGDWKVAVSNVPDVNVANTPSVTMPAPDFVKARTRYEVIWTNGDRELVVVEQLGDDGWVRVNDQRWINVLAARSLEARR